MVLQDVAEGADLLVKSAASFEADRLGDGDLHMFDRLAVPHPLEDRVAEAEHQDVLHGLFAEVVIDAVDLLLVEVAVELRVQLVRRA